MNTIVLGFKSQSNGRGIGPATLVAGPEVNSNAQVKLVSEAKAKNEFPKGITFLQLVALAPRITAIAQPEPETKPETSKKIEPKKETK